jgi:hypothetical protein
MIKKVFKTFFVIFLFKVVWGVCLFTLDSISIWQTVFKLYSILLLCSAVFNLFVAGIQKKILFPENENASLYSFRMP